MYEFPIERGKVREFARATQAEVVTDAEGMVIPPTFLTVAGLTWEREQDRPALDIDQARALHGEETYLFHGELPHAGDTLSVSTRVGDQFVKQGRRGGELRFTVVVREFRNIGGVLVAEQHSTAIETTRAPEVAAQ